MQNDDLGQAAHMLRVSIDTLERTVAHALEAGDGAICVHCGGRVDDTTGGDVVGGDSADWSEYPLDESNGLTSGATIKRR